MEKSRHAARVELLQRCMIALLQTMGWAQRYGVQGSLRVVVLQPLHIIHVRCAYIMKC
jgi:hypothetical protein